jgi:hypothetical protein
MNTKTEQWILGGVVTLIALALIGIAWLRYERVPESAEPAEVPAAAEAEGPEHPLPAPEDAGATGERPVVPLPPLGNSDEVFSLELGSLFGSNFDELLADEAVIEKFVATIDNLPRDKLAERLRPIGKVPGTFAAEPTDDPARFSLDPENAKRYEALVSLFTTTRTEDLLELYRRFYPLFQEAYVGLGYPDGYFNDRVVTVIDDLLATPEPAESPLLVRPHVLYEYADRELESLSSGQKALLRMSDAQRDAVRDKLRELRDALTATESPADDAANPADPAE